MMFRKFIAIFIFAFIFNTFLYTQVKDAQAQKEENAESDQQISEFSLAGYGDKGKKTWDLSGETADIFENSIKLQNLTGNLYGAKEDVKLTADKGDFDKSNGKMHVEENVVITTSSGARLTTDSLDWDRVNQVISTNAAVNIKKENMVTTATGALGHPNLNKMNLLKDVTVEILPQAKKPDEVPSDNKEKMVITCDGPLEIDYAKNVATFNKNVKVDRQDSQIYSDVMDVYFSSAKDNNEKLDNTPMLMGSKIEKIVARGNVKTVRGENITYSDEAIYTGRDKKIILTGRPKLIIYSTEDFQKLMTE